MNWFYAVDGQKHGPVADAQLDNLLSTGKINPQTMVWREGMTNWQPLSQARAAGSSPVAAPEPGLICAECRRSFPPSDLIQINHSSVCAECKPIFLQRLSEGAALPSSTGLWRSGDKVVTVNGTVFPDRCIKCNGPANGYRLKRKLYWHNPAYYFLFLICLCIRLLFLVVLIVLAVTCKKATVHIALCPKHQAGRKKVSRIAWIIIGAGVLLMLSVTVMQNIAPAVFGIFVFLAGGFFGALASRSVVASKITKENVWIKGAKKEFLDSLPEWPGV